VVDSGVVGLKATDSETMYDDSSTNTVEGLQTTTVTPNPAAGQRYLKVNHGGVLGIGAKELYIPFDAVDDVVPGDNVTVNCAKDACADTYGNKPNFLP
jgi:hypothetical protein